MVDQAAFSYPEALTYFSSFEQSTIKLGLQRIHSLLDALGNPQDHFHSIHIAGTNGKGSVAAMLDSLMASQGKMVGRFCSPHLISPRERILIDSVPVSRQWFSASLSYMRDLLGEKEIAPSYFELATALAFYIFNFLKVDIGIIETGLGGRLDATNTLTPELTIISSISLDHTQLLGESLSAIAIEKAGIIKPGVPVVMLNKSDCFQWIATEAKKKSAPVVDVNIEDWIVDDGGYSEVTVRVDGRTISARSPLRGKFQGENLALALAAYTLLSGETGDVSEKLKATRWAGRMETIPSSPPVLLDGAHNMSAITAFLDAVPCDMTEKDLLVFGCMRDKQCAEIFQLLRKRFKRVILTSGNYARFMNQADFEADPVFDAPFESLSGLLPHMREADRVFVTGSLHLVGDVLKTMVQDPAFKEAILEEAPYRHLFDSDPA